MRRLPCPAGGGLEWFAPAVEDGRIGAEARRVFPDLAGRGPLHHRQVKIPGLLIAAVAACNGLTLVLYDADYEIIASVTGQPARWAAPRGSVI